nr:hypothetical protein [Tanacetum cinerariifolium]
EVDEGVADEVHDEGVPAACVVTEGDGRMIVEMDEDDDVVLEKAKDVPANIAKADQDANVLGLQKDESKPTEVQDVVEVVTTAKLITEVVTAASTTIAAAEVPVPAATTPAASKLNAAPSRRTKGVVIRDPEESTTTTSIIVHSEAKSKEKGKGILAKEDPAVKRYQALKRKPQTEAQVRKNMMLYLKNVAGFKINYFKGMSYDDMRLIFGAMFEKPDIHAQI